MEEVAADPASAPDLAIKLELDDIAAPGRAGYTLLSRHHPRARHIYACRPWHTLVVHATPPPRALACTDLTCPAVAMPASAHTTSRASSRSAWPSSVTRSKRSTTPSRSAAVQAASSAARTTAWTARTISAPRSPDGLLPRSPELPTPSAPPRDSPPNRYRERRLRFYIQHRQTQASRTSSASSSSEGVNDGWFGNGGSTKMVRVFFLTIEQHYPLVISPNDSPTPRKFNCSPVPQRCPVSGALVFQPIQTSPLSGRSSN